jgi:hypothetical protein
MMKREPCRSSCRALGAAELQRGQTAAVDDGVDVRRVGIHAGADDEAGLAMRIDPGARELDARLQDEIAGQLAGHELEFVPLRPHVHAARRQRVVLGHRVVGGGPGNLGGADVRRLLEVADRARSERRRYTRVDADDRRRHDPGCSAHGRQITAFSKRQPRNR